MVGSKKVVGSKLTRTWFFSYGKIKFKKNRNFPFQIKHHFKQQFEMFQVVVFSKFLQSVFIKWLFSVC